MPQIQQAPLPFSKASRSTTAHLYNARFANDFGKLLPCPYTHSPRNQVPAFRKVGLHPGNNHGLAIVFRIEQDESLQDFGDSGPELPGRKRPQRIGTDIDPFRLGDRTDHILIGMEIHAVLTPIEASTCASSVVGTKPNRIRLCKPTPRNRRGRS